jgi:hypothetical protein
VIQLTKSRAATAYPPVIGIRRTVMKTTLWRWKDVAVVVGVALAALVIGILTVEFAKANTFASASLGSEWKCHKLPYMEICEHTVQRKSPL